MCDFFARFHAHRGEIIISLILSIQIEIHALNDDHGFPGWDGDGKRVDHRRDQLDPRICRTAISALFWVKVFVMRPVNGKRPFGHVYFTHEEEEEDLLVTADEFC